MKEDSIGNCSKDSNCAHCDGKYIFCLECIKGYHLAKNITLNAPQCLPSNSISNDESTNEEVWVQEETTGSDDKGVQVSLVLIIIVIIVSLILCLIFIIVCIYKRCNSQKSKIYKTKIENEIPAIKSETSLHEIQPVFACSICLEEINRIERVIVLPCGHKEFHNSCIKAWIRVNLSCPLCRSPIAPHLR